MAMCPACKREYERILDLPLPYQMGISMTSHSAYDRSARGVSENRSRRYKDALEVRRAQLRAAIDGCKNNADEGRS